MNIDELTVGQVKEIAKMAGCAGGKGKTKVPFEVGKSYFIRTVTHHYIGRVLDVCDQCIIMEQASWVADDGRFHKLMQGEWDSTSEVEPYPADANPAIWYNGVLDSVEWKHELPSAVK